ncbi:MAG: SAM-dependent methyltransferase [Microbacterium sp.]|uniref:SAM-dependent methyltransferase n=1 Tax=Microbacterium sp. TaxID=51671 RepID=UPI001AD31280|nr:SAM-dependent methyltransferase [Microbacterium sp.]MBN9177230.1 SAM-dependent methyltransferase [Microbacterium sp.]
MPDMPSPFLYFAGDRLSIAELASARLDGDLVEIGDAYMPADAVETRELRAASLTAYVSDALAVIRQSAAWVHGALAEPPTRHTVQRRAGGARGSPPVDLRLVCREQPVSSDDLECIGGVWVSTPARTLADLVRLRPDGEDVDRAIDAMLAAHPGLATDALEVLTRTRGLRFKRPAMTELRRRARSGSPPDGVGIRTR